MRLLRCRLRRDERGAATVEMAFALPIIVLVMWVMVQLGLVFRAVAGIQHALGEGARVATVYPTPDTDDPIIDAINDAVYGIGPGEFDDPVVERDTANGYLTLQVSYSQKTDLLIVPGPTIRVSRSKRVWAANDLSTP